MSTYSLPLTAPRPGHGHDPDMLTPAREGEPVVMTLAVPEQGHCPSCVALLRTGDVALLLAPGPWCVAPYTHARADGRLPA